MTQSEDQVRIEGGMPPLPAALPRDETAATPAATPAAKPREVGGRDGPEPTRFGDWELRGRCIDF
jgi:hypothetical protein